MSTVTTSFTCPGRALIDGAEYARNDLEETASVWATEAEWPEPLALQTLQELALERRWDPTPDQRYFTNTGETERADRFERAAYDPETGARRYLDRLAAAVDY